MTKGKKTAAVKFNANRLGKSTLTLVASNTVRTTLIFLGIGIAIYLSYLNVWQPLTQSAILPPGIPAKNPTLKIETLQGLNAEIDSRRTFSARSYRGFLKVFSI